MISENTNSESQSTLHYTRSGVPALSSSLARNIETIETVKSNLLDGQPVNFIENLANLVKAGEGPCAGHALDALDRLIEAQPAKGPLSSRHLTLIFVRADLAEKTGICNETPKSISDLRNAWKRGVEDQDKDRIRVAIQIRILALDNTLG